MKRGSLWETRLDVWHQSYRASGEAVIVHLHPRASVGKEGRIFFAAKGPPDYMGATARKGNFIFDAKEVGPGKKLYTSLLAHHQAQYLEGYSKMPGWRAGVMGKLGTRMFWFDWAIFGPLYWDGALDFDPSLAVEFGKTGWLEVM